MTCKEKDRDTCNVEKMGCEGCFYNRASNEEVKEIIIKQDLEFNERDIKGNGNY